MNIWSSLRNKVTRPSNSIVGSDWYDEDWDDVDPPEPDGPDDIPWL